ncbi:nucleotidyltransferase family protein [Infirmifilum lucidum]|uniref:Nucleotidyltransferase family protein n=1 Tax=Infirmifilum lucidum TaxID=2776706 RepID=A0A7L9FHL7_9CREN|nr:nucleotidyltransferase family protein [Infirmifilum lucidum]QOJ78493.1 nucleotidyltransferase family protein [Infirmifilum lucidum]
MTQNVIGVVLCGGEGRRLRPLTYYFQKAMIPIGSQQKPLLEYIVRLMKYHGINNIVMLVGYKGQQIVNYFNNGERYNVKISYVWDDPSFGGNGGALYNAYLKGVFDSAENILVYYGDILSDINLTEMLKFHEEGGFAATLALSPNYRVAVGVAELNGHEVVEMVEKPPLGKPVTIGILAVRRRALELLHELAEVKKEIDIMGDLIRALIERKFKVGGYLTTAFWFDLGTTEAYEKLDPSDVDKKFSFLFQE